MVRSSVVVVNPFLLVQTIFLFCFSSFLPTISLASISSAATTLHSYRIRLGNETDRLSLLAFKDQLIDDPLNVFSSWNESTHFCLWKGVTCGRRHHRVVALHLTSQGLVGHVSPHIGNLSFLREVYFGSNSFQGNIPPEISHLSRLQYLYLDNNSFGGPIPTNLVHCSNLIHLYLNYNKLVGKIPNEFGSFTKLLWLILGSNHLTGPIPVALGNISTLQQLLLEENELEGSIPNSLGQLKDLTELSLGENMLSGIVPSSIYNLSALQIVSITLNKLQGSLLPSIGRDFPNLEIFYIGGNNFSGTLPVSLFTNVSRLSQLDVGSNNFVGQIPIEVGNLKEIISLKFGQNHFGSGGKKDDLGFITSLSNCTKLEEIFVIDNNFGGRLPASLTNLSITLKELHLGINQIFGSIPSDISKLKNLVSLGMPYNFLTRTIPKDIGMLQALQYLGLGNNRLTGKIPYTIGNLTSLYWLYLSDNMLEGNVEVSLEKCMYLQNLFMSDNHFTGNLPKQILSRNLLKLDLSNNYLNGPLPQEVGQQKHLFSLDLSGNKLSGEIPTTLGSCFGLEELYLAHNSFQGPIPNSFGDLVAIEIIDLSRNNLTGKIPKNLENLQYLGYLNISFNNFEGEVPTKGIFQNRTGFSMAENDKLCGGSFILKLPKCDIQKLKKKEFPTGLKATIGVLVSLSIIGTVLTLLALLLRKKSIVRSVSRKYAHELQRISYNDIHEATNEFSSSNLVGIGSFASVYTGILRESESVIAVKVFNLMERGASKSFETECEILRKIRHRNLLKILTVCSSVDFNGNDFKALILEFMPYGSLDDWLHPSSNRSQRLLRTLNLWQRLNIAIDVASALDYLHNSNDTPIVHCDLKPSNVLLNEDLVARVGDFGLAKFLSKNHSGLDKSKTNSNAVRGTVGYIPPEYGMGSSVSTKGDVYSYGIMVLEMFTGRRPTDEMFNHALSLHNFCKLNLAEQNVDMFNIIQLMESPQNDTDEERRMTWKKCLFAIIEIGVACSSESVGDRMEIKDVLTKLQKIKEALLRSMNPKEKTTMKSHI